MARLVICCILIIAQNFVSCQEKQPLPSIAASTPDPYANVLSQLSDVIFDVEDRLYRLTSPNVESNSKGTSFEEHKSSRRNYFDQIRENYKALQDQVEQTLASPGGLLKLPDIMNLNFQTKGPRSAVDLSLPFLPLNIKLDAKTLPTKIEPVEKVGEVIKDSLKLHSPFSDVRGQIKIGGKEANKKENSEKILKMKKLQPELQKRAGRPVVWQASSQSESDNKKKRSTDFKDYSNPMDFIPKETRLKNEPGVQGRILGDVLFSESSFDTYFRRFLNDHGKWLFDSSISPPTKVIEGIRDVTRDQFSSGITSKNSWNGNQRQTSRVSKLPQGAKTNHMPFGRGDETKFFGPSASSTGFNNDAEMRIILAFTPEGLPLKLKMHSSVRPLRFLQRVLSEARVSLNIPVSSMDGIQPVGNGILHLGYEDDVMPSRTPVLDLTDQDQLGYLLDMLRRLKHEHV